MVNPFLGVRGRPDQQQILNSDPDIQCLRYDDHPRTRSRLPKPREVPRHRLPIVRNQNSTRFRGDADYVGVGQTDDSAINGVHEIDRWLPPANANSDLLVEIGVSQETWPHARGA